jgi:[NiFe] hydrogenase assembly HybE family chaperone
MTSGPVLAAAAGMAPGPNPTDRPDRPNPTAALEARFASIWREHMQDVPMVNPALRVQAVGFVPWDHHWLGVLVTPWFMNLVLLPRVQQHWHRIGERESRHHVFPAGVFEFISNQDAVLGNYQACSLFSPMFEFADHDTAVATASSALAALFDAGNRPASDVPASATAAAATAASAAAATPPPEPKPALSKRDFLFGSKPRADRGA